MLFQIEMASSYTQTHHTHTHHTRQIYWATYVLKSPGLGQAERVTYVLRARTRYLSVTQPVQSVHDDFLYQATLPYGYQPIVRAIDGLLDMKIIGPTKGCMLCDHPKPWRLTYTRPLQCSLALARTSWSESWNEWMHTYIHSIAPSEYF